MDERLERTTRGDAAFDAFGDELAELGDVALAVAVAGRLAGLHRAHRAHAAVRLEAAVLGLDDLAGRLVDARQQPAEHDGVRARADRLRDVARFLDPAVRADRHAGLRRGVRAIEDRGDLRHARAGDDAGRADRARPHTHLDAVGAGGDEVLRAGCGHHVARHDLHPVAGLDLLDHPDDAGRVSLGDVHEDHVHPGGDEGAHALVGVAGDAHCGSHVHAGRLAVLHVPALLIDREVPMEHAHATKPAEGDGHARLGDRVHGRREQRDVEGQLAGEEGAGRDLGGEYVAAGRDEEHVVEGEPFGAELLLRDHATALTRSSVPSGTGATWPCSGLPRY